MPSRLLLINDNWEALEYYEGRLAPYFEVHGAPFGGIGIQMAHELKPDRILLDLAFEDMSAEEACERLREDPVTSGIPLTWVYNEGEGAPVSQGRFPRAGDQWLKRPFEFTGLLAVLQGFHQN